MLCALCRLMTEKLWDQTAYNQQIFFLSHGDYKSPQVGGLATLAAGPQGVQKRAAHALDEKELLPAAPK